MSTPSAGYKSPFVSDADDLAGRANYEAWCEAGREWLPAPPAWDSLSKHVQACWIAGAKAAKTL